MVTLPHPGDWLGRRIRGWPIRRRLLAGFLVILTCLGGVVVLVVGQLVVFRQAIQAIDHAHVYERRMMGQVDAAYSTLRTSAFSLLTSPDDESSQRAADSIRQEIEHGLSILQAMIETLRPVMEQDQWRHAEHDLQQIRLSAERLVNVVNAMRDDHSVDAYLAFSAVVEQVEAQLRDLEVDVDAVVLQKTGALRRHVNRLIVGSASVFLVALGLSVWLSMVIARSLTIPIGALSDAAGRMASGEFVTLVPPRTDPGAQDEVAVLGAAFTTMSQVLQRQLRQLHELNETLETRVSERTGELARRNAELDTFTYMVSHDLKSPVVALHGLVSILIEDYGPSMDDEGRRYLDRLLVNTAHMSRLIQDLLLLSRVGRSPSRCESVPVREVIEEILVFHETAIRDRGIRIDVSPALPTLTADRVQLQQVFQNLVSNAIKFLGDQPTPVIVVGCDDADTLIRFEVRDNGIGIDPAFHEKVFTIFQRLKEVDVEGTGVGLAIVKKVVEQAGGRVGIQSEKGQGTTFWFTWPRDATNALPRAA